MSKYHLILIANTKQNSRSNTSAEKRTKYFRLTVGINFHQISVLSVSHFYRQEVNTVKMDDISDVSGVFFNLKKSHK